MERLSALMDGELEDREVALELSRIKERLECQTMWSAYHVIGDVLRGDFEGQMKPDNADILQKVVQRLQDEPAIVAPRFGHVRQVVHKVALPLAASVCGVALVAWLVLSNDHEVRSGPQFVGDGAVATVNQGAENAQLADASLEDGSWGDASQEDADAMAEYMMAHQQFSPSTVMQGVVPYVRTVAATDGNR